jgi:hypothetical protein
MNQSAILLLQEYYLKQGTAIDRHGHGGLSFDDLWLESREALDRISSTAETFAAAWPHDRFIAENVPIFLIHVVYQVATFFLVLAQGAPDDDTKQKMETLKHLLYLIDQRWHLAGEFRTMMIKIEYNY